MGILFRPMDTADIGSLRELLEDDGMIYHPEYLNRFFASPGGDGLLLSVASPGWKNDVFSVFAGPFACLAGSGNRYEVHGMAV